MVAKRLYVVGCAVAAVVVVALAGCSPYDTAQGGQINKAVTQALKPQEDAGVASVDFGSLVEGHWTHMVVACYPIPTGSLDAALGFDWHPRPDFESPLGSSFAVLVFATDDAVEDYLDVGQNDYDENYYFNPCPEGGSGNSGVLSFDRGDAVLTLQIQRDDIGGSYWYLPQDEFDQLKEAQDTAQ